MLKLCADMTRQAGDSHRVILLSQTLLLDLQAVGQVTLNKQSLSLSEYTGTSLQSCVRRQFDFSSSALPHCHEPYDGRMHSLIVANIHDSAHEYHGKVTNNSTVTKLDMVQNKPIIIIVFKAL